MKHPLLGRKQRPEHILKRVAAIKEALRLHPRPLRDIRKKLLNKVDKLDNGCWQWTGAIFKKPYGNYAQIRIGRRGNSKCKKAHVVAYEEFVGKIPEGLELDHLCRNTLCINPVHLEPVTHAENMKRRKDSGLPNCRYGHLYTPETTYYRKDNGRRECKACRKLRHTN